MNSKLLTQNLIKNMKHQLVLLDSDTERRGVAVSGK
jgi:hypothetical protein